MNKMATSTARRRKERNVIKPLNREDLNKNIKNDIQSSCGMSRLLKTLGIAILLISTIGYYRSPITPEIVVLSEDVPLAQFINPESNCLERGEHIIEGLPGPESIEIDEHGNVYTGLLDGRIIKIHRSATGEIGVGLVEDIVSGPVTGVDPIDSHSKPRPLGLRLRQKTLYVVDAFYGLYSVNLVSKQIQVLVRPTDVHPNMKFPNDLDISEDGEYIYFTDTSFKWNIHELYYDILEGTCTGRFFRYSLKTGDIKLLANKLCFPNGVQLLENQNTALVSETSRYRVLFIDTRHGKVTNYIELPGYPDNIRKSAKPGYWVALPIARTTLSNFVTDHPLLRKIVTGIIPVSWIKNFSNVLEGVAVRFDEHGEILEVIHDLTGKVSSTVSEVTEMDDGTIFAGSYSQPFIVKCHR